LRFITARVAASATGMVSAGMAVAQNRLRNTAMTSTTRAMAIRIVCCTSAMEARISVVRS
jgi:hypothetical protein